MTYIAITQGTADWLLGKAGLLDILHNLVVNTDEHLDELVSGEFVEGQFRLSASVDGKVIAIWNTDYLSGTGEEAWGFIKRDGEFGLNNKPSISREVFERCIHIVNQRLQGLFIDGAWIHRSWPNGAHTCLAGRGSQARHASVGYFERNIDLSSAPQRTIICIGPEFDYRRISVEVENEAKGLDSYIENANKLTSPNRRKKVLSSTSFSELRKFLAPYEAASDGNNEYANVQVATTSVKINERDVYRAIGLTYNDWLASNSPLSDVQRRILFSDAIEHHPLRIVGPGGSGKTLLMQLLAMRRLQTAKQKNQPLRIMYIVHNAAMAETVKQRFNVLDGGDEPIRDKDRTIIISTLAEYGRQQLELEQAAIIDPDAHEAKIFQLEQVTEALRGAMDAMPDAVKNSPMFSAVNENSELFSIMARLIMAEISTAIKGHGFESDKKRYVQSERRLSRLHGILTQEERQIVYHTYEKYHQVVFEDLSVLDTDDIAISLLGKLRTPIWQLKRKKLGYDYVFVDETQLFNENERRVLPLLTNGQKGHVPVVLALDEAQDVYSQSSAGMATLGIPGITNESLASVHRSTKSIIRLAFFVIQRSTDLFGPDFPDFTGIAVQLEPDNHPLAATPIIEAASEEVKRLGKFVVRRIRELRKANLRQIAVICHSDQYWDTLADELRGTDLPLHILLQRGEKLSPDQPLVVLTRPLYSGGQEFDAVILVGLEQGIVPPRVVDNEALSSAVEQQSLREMYLAITRARYRVIVALSAGASLTGVLQEAEKAGHLTRRQV